MAVRLNELAPAAVARVAAWSFDRLDGLDATELAAKALDATERDGAAWAAFTEAYRDTVDAQRIHLARVTTSDPRFARALALAHPQLSTWIETWRPDEPRNKRVRHLETSLYRYLARAVGRTEPCDAWAGVAEATWSEDAVTRIEPAAPTYRFTPDLRPFQQIVRALAGRPTYRSAGPWRLAPTLHRTSPRIWEFIARDDAGRLRRRELTGDVQGDQIILALALAEPAGLGALTERVASLTALDRADITDVLDAFVDAGVLTGGLTLPPRFESPWQALGAVAAQLDAADRSLWLAAVASLSTIADRLTLAMEDAPAAEVVELLHGADEVVARLGNALGVASTDRPRTTLRCDLGAPIRLVLGRSTRAHLATAIDEYERCQTVSLPASALRRELAAEVAAYCGSGRPIAAALDAPSRRTLNPASWQELLTLVQPSDDLIERVEKWDQLLETPLEEVECDVRGEPDVHGPFATLMVGLRGRDDSADPGLTVFGIMDEVAPVIARYQGLIGDALLEWHRMGVVDLEQRCGVEVADLLADCATSPNTLARPTFATRSFDLWGATPGAESLLGSELVSEHAGHLMLRVPSCETPLAVSTFSSSDVAASDPLAEVLMRSSFRDGPSAQFHASSLPVASELRTQRFTPRACLPCGAVVRARRTVITGAELASLLASTGARRYASWCRLAAHHGWPRYVTAQREGALIAMPTTSPLALEAVLEGARGGARMLVVQELVDSCVMLPDGSRHVVELAVPFARARHAWSVRSPAARERSWLQLDIAVADADAARRALETIAPLADDFFFMRKPPGLRVRIDCKIPRELVAAHCLAALEPLERLRLVRDVRVGRYEPETTLFGGPAAMARVHAFFCADTRAWLALAADPSTDSHALPSAVLVELFASTLDRSEVWDAWLTYQRLLPPAGPAIKPLSLDHADALEAMLPLAQRDAVRAYRRAARELAAGVLAVARAGHLDCGVRMLLPFIALFTFHRWGIRGDLQARIAAALVDRHDPRPVRHAEAPARS